MANTPNRPVLESKRIFYIEDDVKNRLVVQMILENAGAKVDFERWGFVEIVIPKLRAFRPDLILLDLMFPMKHSGYDVFDAIRQCEEFSVVPVVALSASDPAVEVPKAKAKGFAGFISKPIDLHDFPAQIARILTGSELWAD